MNKKYLLAVAVSTLMFAACGDDVTEVTNIQQSGLAVLESGEKLSKQACDTTNVGEMLFVMDSSEAFICDGESWQTLKGADGVDGKDGSDGKDGKDGEKGEKGDKGSKGDSGKNGEDGNDGNDGTSCTATKNTDGSFDLVCGGKPVGTITNGSNGTNGTSCTAEPVTNAAGLEGLEVTCGETVVDMIWNGKDGEKGDPGKNGDNGNDGVGCSLEDNGEGAVSVTCGEGEGATTTTIFKAVCGAIPYDPAKSFCLEGEVYDLCDGKTYDPVKSFCSEGELYSCNDKPYDPKKQYCKLGTTVEDYGWLTDSRDKHVYKTVEIGDQTWMAENLNYDYNEGTAKSYCFGDIDANCEVTGRLYTWAAAIDSVALANDVDDPQTCGYKETCTLPAVVQGVCPSGWHLPTDAEWKTLFAAVSVGYAEIAGKMLKSQTGWNDNGNGEDAYGFSALPAGNRDFSGYFGSAGEYAYFWSASENNGIDAYGMLLFCSYEGAALDFNRKNFGLSVRCLQNN